MSNYERNVQRILNPPPPTLRERVGRILWGLEEFWCRHVTQRELYRRLDNARLLIQASMPPDRHSAEQLERSLQRIRDAVAAERAGAAGHPLHRTPSTSQEEQCPPTV